MRMIALAVAAFVASTPAVAQSWEEYSYPDYAFSVVFPANPQVETMTYQVADNRSVPAHVYSVRHNDTVLKVTVAEIGNTGLDEGTVIDHAIKMLSQGGEVKDNIPQRVDSVYGRQVSLAWADGSQLGSCRVRLQWTALPDRGQSTSGQDRQLGGHTPLRAIVGIYGRRIEPFGGYDPRASASLSKHNRPARGF